MQQARAPVQEQEQAPEMAQEQEQEQKEQKQDKQQERAEQSEQNDERERRRRRGEAKAEASAVADEAPAQITTKVEKSAAPAQGTTGRVWSGACLKVDGCTRPCGHTGRCKVAAFEEVEYEVESILDERKTGKRTFYLVKWLGWPLEDCTWEQASALETCPKILKAWDDAKRS